MMEVLTIEIVKIIQPLEPLLLELPQQQFPQP